MAHSCLRRAGAGVVQKFVQNAGEAARGRPLARGLSSWATHDPFTPGTGRPLFKLVETDFISRELIRYDSADAELLGLYSIEEVIGSLNADVPRPVEVEEAVSAAVMPVPCDEGGGEESREGSGLGCPKTEASLEDGTETDIDRGVGAEKLAIKRTYQPSVLKRKRKHGFLSRVKTRLGKKIIQRRLEKGRWRMAV